MVRNGKFELEWPYSRDWKFGYIVINGEPRRNVILYNSPSERTTVSLARYLYEVSIGDYLDKDVHVDHIDGDVLNDTLSNYQLISQLENNRKSLVQNNRTRQVVDFLCGSCGEPFTRDRNKTHLVVNKKSDYCSKVCSGYNTTPSTIIRQYRIGE